ncbi:hypothetical protein GO594_27660 [Pseudomonas otitidis]|uniref:Uncharacterized protein n=1 Tax=Metapseudomonas otitidis TaxID=319939 RepID=A0A7X3KWL3_9GAMM|nr:hypothetical protein [Pseudomonas otitidis]MWK59781.1 hypothetical protein [Pseudomonas otitidis]
MKDQSVGQEEESSPRVKRLAAFSADQLNDHLMRRGGVNVCEGCGTSEWSISMDTKGRPSMIKCALFDPEDKMLLFIPLFCKRCGNTRFINAAQVIEPEQGDDPDGR